MFHDSFLHAKIHGATVLVREKVLLRLAEFLQMLQRIFPLSNEFIN
jgi:hypothetical protein